MFNNHMDYPKATISMRNAFKLDLPSEMMLEGMAPGNPFTPKLIEDYVFDTGRFRDLLTFWVMGFKALKLSGDPATGKTSIVEQWHARLGMPLFVVSCHENMTDTDIFGQLVPKKDGTLEWVDSPILRTHRYGGSVLLDEWNNLNPNAASLLNAILEGYAITIPQTGEVIEQSKGARFFCTQNPVDGMAAVQGRYVQDCASDDRFMEINVDYLPAELEAKVIVNAIRQFDKGSNDEAVAKTAEGLVSIANEVRTRFRANDVDFHKPMSTRVLKRWAQLIVGFRNVRDESPVLYAMDRAVSGISTEMRSAIREVAKEKLGLQ